MSSLLTTPVSVRGDTPSNMASVRASISYLSMAVLCHGLHHVRCVVVAILRHSLIRLAPSIIVAAMRARTEQSFPCRSTSSSGSCVPPSIGGSSETRPDTIIIVPSVGAATLYSCPFSSMTSVSCSRIQLETFCSMVYCDSIMGIVSVLSACRGSRTPGAQCAISYTAQAVSSCLRCGSLLCESAVPVTGGTMDNAEFEICEVALFFGIPGGITY